MQPLSSTIAAASPAAESIDLLSEDRVGINELARELRVDPSTIWRWINKGVRGIRLESYAEGGRRYTTRPAVHRFRQRSTAAASQRHGTYCTQDSQPRESAIDRAEAQLAMMTTN